MVFESKLRDNMYPLSLTRPSFDFLCGTSSLLENIERVLQKKVTHLIVPKYLEALCKESHPGCSINTGLEGRCLAVNALLNPAFPLLSELRKALDSKGQQELVAVDPSGSPVFGVFDNFQPEILSSVTEMKRISVDLGCIEPALFSYPWELVSENGDAICRQARELDRGASPNCEVFGSRLHVKESVEIEKNVTIDTRAGDVVIAEGAQVQSFSRITGPAFVGKGSIIKSAKLWEGTTIGKACKVGGEVEQTILFEYTNKNHEGFLGHSVIGSWANLGALTTNSDLKNTYGKIKVSMADGEVVNSELNKVGCFIGDITKTSIGTLIMSGKMLGVASQIFGTVTENVPSFTMYASSLEGEAQEIYLESALETQRRMMARRNLQMSDSYADLIKAIHEMTSKDRAASRVGKGKFQLNQRS